jgi:hypothetical protein
MLTLLASIRSKLLRSYDCFRLPGLDGKGGFCTLKVTFVGEGMSGMADNTGRGWTTGGGPADEPVPQ